jgi:two-component system CheB/CheR fusion protein
MKKIAPLKKSALKTVTPTRIAKTPDTPDTPETPDPIPAPGFPIVGIGASAGGLPAFEAFFSAMPADKDTGNESALKKIFILLRSQTGHDFSHYKQNTIARRIERRMAVHQIDLVDGYVLFLQQNPAEVTALFRDLLIGVTNFFRDPEVFTALEKDVIPQVLANKTTGQAVRVWVPGCSTGEEAYSIAILLQEGMERQKQSFKLQVFATDIDATAIDSARAGIYPASIAADLSPQRLRRFFTKDPDESLFRIHKSIRDILVFSEQDLIKDPPFSRLDLISCRNLLIYLDGELQKKLIPLFHYSLLPRGFLLLGASETVGDFHTIFTSIDRAAKLYQRKENAGGIVPRSVMTNITPPLPREKAKPHPDGRALGDAMHSLRETTERALLQHFAPVGALVNELGDILYIHGRSGLYLEPAPGEAGMNILKMAREGLRRDLTTALHRAVARHELVQKKAVRVKTNGDFSTIDLTVQPIASGPAAKTAPALFLVVLEQAPPAQPPVKGPIAIAEKGGATRDAALTAENAALKQELRAKEEYLQSVVEEMETSNEELKSTNEEMQSVNEELQSTNEELETSREELQSVNEELSTVNNELQTKVADLSRANNDINNLLAGTGIGTIFVDHGLRILRFTPTITQIINLIATDVGRPVMHIVSNLKGYDHLTEDVKAVLDNLIPKEIEVQTIAGGWYLLRIMPYRTIENVIEGAVITFVDITAMKKLQEKIAK